MVSWMQRLHQGLVLGEHRVRKHQGDFSFAVHVNCSFLGSSSWIRKAMATHSCILAWRSSRTEEPGGLQSMGRKEADTTEAAQHTHPGSS